MAASSWSKIISAIAFLQLLFASAKASDLIIQPKGIEPFNSTTNLQNYIAQNQQKYEAQIASLENQLADFRATYQRQLTAINIQRELTEVSLNEVEQRLGPLELLNQLNRYCIQKYRSILANIATLRQQVNSCVSTASSAITSILSSAQNSLQLCINYLGSNVRTGLLNCERIHNNSYENHTNCVVQLINTTNIYFYNNLRNFNGFMETARCTADTRIRQAIECSFKPIQNALSSIGAATRLIDDCIASVGMCETCPEIPEQCPNIVDYPGTPNFGNNTNGNPFSRIGNELKLNDTINCLLIYFVPEK